MDHKGVTCELEEGHFPKAPLCSAVIHSGSWSELPRCAAQNIHTGTHYSESRPAFAGFQHHQPTLLPNEGLEDVHVPSHAAVREIKMQALPGHIVLQYDDAVVLQAISAPKETQEGLYQSGTLQVRPSKWGNRMKGCGKEVSRKD